MNDCYIARNLAAAARALDGKMVIMSADSCLFILNKVASAIWNAADGFTPLSEIVEKIVCERFEIDSATARADTEEFVNNLSQHGILIVSDQPIHETGPGAKL